MNQSPVSNTTLVIQRQIELLRQEEIPSRQVIDDLITYAVGRLEKLARQMLRSYPRLSEETGDLLSSAYQRLLRALHDEQVRKRLVTAQDFFRLSALQIRRELTDLARRHQRRGDMVSLGSPPDTNHSSMDLTPADNTLNPEQLAVWSEFHTAVEQLPDAEREAFELIWYHELSYAEVARMWQIDERNVRRRFQGARRRLYEALHGQLPL